MRSELAYVLPSFRPVSGGGTLLQDERYRAHRAVRELLERLAARRPLVLVLDDVHWADAASVDLLAALLRTPPDAAVLLVMAVRPRQIPDRLAAALERADRHGGLARLELGGLPREAAGDLLGALSGASERTSSTRRRAATRSTSSNSRVPTAPAGSPASPGRR